MLGIRDSRLVVQKCRNSFQDLEDGFWNGKGRALCRVMPRIVEALAFRV